MDDRGGRSGRHGLLAKMGRHKAIGPPGDVLRRHPLCLRVESTQRPHGIEGKQQQLWVVAWLNVRVGVLVLVLLAQGCVVPDVQEATDSSEPTPPASVVDVVVPDAGEPLLVGENATGEETGKSPPDMTRALTRIHVNTSLGPHGGAPIAIDRRLYGMNIADWQPKDYVPEPHPTFTSYLAALQPGILRWPAGESSQEYRWSREGPVEGTKTLTPADVDAFVQLARGVKAEPVIAINVKTGTPREAADLVRYVNEEKEYDVRWWQIGNEPDLPDGLTRGPNGYARQFQAFARAMRDIDPAIQLVGGELMTGAHVIASNGAQDWLTPILRRAGEDMDAISWHYYPLDGSRTNAEGAAAATLSNLFQEEATDWRPAGLTFVDDVFPPLLRARGTYAPGAEIWVTEYGEDWYKGGTEGLVDTHAGALWAAEVLGRFAAHGVDAMAKWIFKSGSDHRYTLLDPDYHPRPAYYAYWLFANHFGDRMVNATSDDRELVNAHAGLRSDGRLAVVVVNKDTVARDVSLDFSGFEPKSAGQYVVKGESLDARNVTLNGETLHPENLAGITMVPPEPIDVEGLARLSVAPLSLTMLVIER